MIEWYEAWASDARRRGLAARYIAQQRARIEHLSKFADGRTIDAALIRDWLTELSENGIVRATGQARACSAKTLNNHLAALRAFLGWCVGAGLVEADPSAGVPWARAHKRKGRVLSARQAWAIFEAAQQDERSRAPRCRDSKGRVVRRSAYYRVLIATGIRAGAADGLRVRDFELNAEPPRIVVRAELDKSDTERCLIISEEDRDYFAAHLEGLDPGARAVSRPHYRVLYDDARAAGIPAKDSQGRGVGFHCFRRWHGTEMDRQGFSVEQIRQRLGHKSILSTMGYLVRELEEQQGVAEALSRTGRKISEISLDPGNRMADAESAETASPSIHGLPVDDGERPAPRGLSSFLAQAPHLIPVKPPGSSPGRIERAGQQALPHAPQSGRQDLNLRPGRNAELGVAADLLHRFLDLLSETPGRKAEGRDEQG